MKTHALISWTAGVALALGLTAAAAEAQTTPVVRGDVTASIGWLGFDTRTPRRPGDQKQWDGTLYGGLSAGWYWTDHFKTEVELGAAQEAHGFGFELVNVDGRILNRYRRSTVDRRILGLSQQYQYGRNAWFHPHVAFGVSIAFDRRTDYYDPLVNYTVPGYREVEPARTEGPLRSTSVRPFLGGGFKAYLSPRAFFRMDARLGGGTAKRGLDEALARIGFGIDF